MTERAFGTGRIRRFIVTRARNFPIDWAGSADAAGKFGEAP
jgi:hypothetical protein